MPRASSHHRTSNVRSCDVSMSGPIAVYATAIPVFSYAGMWNKYRSLTRPFFHTSTSSSTLHLDARGFPSHVHIDPSIRSWPSLSVFCIFIKRYISVTVWQTNGLMGEAIPPAFLPNPQQMPTYVLLDAIQYWGLKV